MVIRPSAKTEGPLGYIATFNVFVKYKTVYQSKFLIKTTST